MIIQEDYCFVIMPFSDELRGVYDDVIKPSVESTGLRCIRVDEVEGTANIVRSIVEYIHNAKIVIADLTHKNPNVFYELGISHVLGNNTIVIAQNLNDVPFDVKSYKVIQYSDSIAGGRRLGNELNQAISTFERWGRTPSNPVQDFLPQSARDKVPKEELIKVEHQLAQREQSLKEAQRKLSELERDRAQLGELKAQSQELEFLRNLMMQLFQNSMSPEQLKDNVDVAEVVQDIINKVENEGEVSVNVQGEPTVGKRAGTGKIIFKKIN